ncbi:glycine C-acetyltransferase [Bradyrhizobium japonicum]|jgi:glycine C-acetyltransferase|uniref:2-amino-3-ketobutyrate coenzyme A ligase n=1 Tax=Bradyrhizobium japonicum TaxID=375 RepID=A0ABV2S131_BRAJP|nr:glycine C-acetyltransferase [Bradyrhizobium japonicum]MBR0749682.1 glycine C-acetyltransferase [Bradyrhizobium japonicum]MCS3501822.1 glycine C-acetyltransferase [Bradyrhizobium japonicum]MCS3965464.1 glycine C-acetyltransferase [Bradyrhizobium japonicum]MCS3997771.1 glycine C-acetyltransferase [Bradyrhizobium japonicum]UQE02579.1 glycine C-acetyltransferase [Bradyrhizobium japonicum]
MAPTLEGRIRELLSQMQAEGLYKHERMITGAQAGRIRVVSKSSERELVNLCANNYLGLADHPEVIAAAKRGLDEFGFGMASVRFICGTQTLHRELERTIARYLGKDDAILFAACFDANGGVFEPLLETDDAVISDSLNHASIIDGVRLCKARRYRFANGDMNELEDRLKEADRDGARFKLIATDGVFSMDGYVARLPAICALAERYGAAVMVDDCHATGHIGEAGRGTPTLTGTNRQVDIVTGTLGKSLGGAMGGFVAASQPIVDLLRQRARPYLFSNSLAPAVAAGSIKAIQIAETADDRRQILAAHMRRFRSGLEKAGFELLAGETPIIPVMLHDARLAQDIASALDERGIYVAAFFFPVVPKGKARIRTQMSAALSEKDVELAVDAFADAGKALGVI